MNLGENQELWRRPAESIAGAPVHTGMDGQEISDKDLERFAAAMAMAIPDLDCPDCCEQGWKYRYVELSAALYRDEWEWHCLMNAIIRYRHARKSG